jgi:HEAT repeat protein
VALGALDATQSIDRIFEAVKETSTLQFTYVAAKGTLASLAANDSAPLIQRVTDDDVNVRRLAVQCLVNRDIPAFRAALLKAAAEDSDPYVRELALSTLAGLPADEQSIGAVMAGLSDADETVQARCATFLAQCVPHAPTPDGEAAKKDESIDQPGRFALYPPDTAEGKVQRDALARLIEFFKKYGDGTSRTDADWGWRAVGNSILCFGEEGEAKLKELIADTSDRKLAENAWQVVYIRQKALGYCLVDEQQDAEAHEHHPFLNQ